MSRFLVLAVCCALLAVPSALAGKIGDPGKSPRAKATGPATSWAQAPIRDVVSHGLMAKTVAAFRAADTLTQGELASLVAGLTKQPASATASPSAPVTVAQLDARLVRSLQLSDAATAFADGAKAAGLAVPARFGTESVARLLGLRTDHPLKQDDLELLPSDPVTRAETAYSVAKILHFRGWEPQYALDASASFTLPQLGAWQKRVLNTAVRFIGFPYVWGGTSELPEAPFGVSAPGGFDCSGFVWRVYKLQAYTGRRGARRDDQGPHDLPDERRGAEVQAHRVREAGARRRALLRPERPALEVGLDRPHRHLPRRRLDDPLLRPGRRGEPAHGLVPPAVRLGPPASGRSRPDDLALGAAANLFRTPLPGDVARLQGFDNRRRLRNAYVGRLRCCTGSPASSSLPPFSR